MNKPKSSNSVQTSVALFDAPERRRSAGRSFICFGSPRCGTSMVAGAMVGLGIDMGDNLAVNIENPVFNIDGKRDNRPAFMQGVREAIRRYRDKGEVWGWKYPQAVEYLPAIRGELADPRLVIVFRDPVPATIRAAGSKTDPAEIDLVGLREMEKCITLFQRNLELAKAWRVPALLVSYERASQHPEVFLDELARFSGMDLPADISPIVEFMRPGEYKAPPVPAS